MTKKDLNSMAVKEMIHCEGCGGYHSMEDSEIVVIKIIKGKECYMPSASPARGQSATSHVTAVIPPPMDIPPPQPPAPPAPPRKKIIPPGLLSMMMDPTNPHFDQYGAKEFRRV